MTRILVTGCAGYIGSVCSAYLQDQGVEVLGLDSLQKGKKELIQTKSFWQADIGDAQALESIFSQGKIDAVFHFAALATVSESFQYPERYMENNVEKLKTLLSLCEKHAVSRVIFSSTCAVYGIPQKLPLSEDHPLQPISPYGESKKAAEELLRDWAHKSQSQVLVFRYFNAAGADPKLRCGEWHEPETHLIPSLFEAIVSQKAFSLYGTTHPTPDGTCIRDFISVWDVARYHWEGYRWLLQQEAPYFDVCNLGRGEGFSVQEVIEKVQSITGHRVTLQKLPPRKGDPPRLEASSQKATARWGSPLQDLDTMIALAWKWFQKMRENKK